MGARIYGDKIEFILDNFRVNIGAMRYSDLPDLPLVQVLSEYVIGGSFGVGTTESFCVHLP